MKKQFKPMISTLLILILLFPVMPIFATETEATLTEYPFEDIITVSDMPDNNELFTEHLEHTLYPSHYATFGISARARLSKQDQSLYDALKIEFDKIANGETESAMFVIDAKNLSNIENEFLANYTESSVRACFAKFWAQFDFDTIFDALLHDCVYEFYWFDKTKGGGLVSFQSVRLSPLKFRFETLTFSFSVAQDYQPEDYDKNNPTLDIVKTKGASNVSDRAHAIVKKHESLSDYQKLLAYKTEICNLVDYNHDAAKPSYNDGYGDPWQIIYVFDGLESTNVVCEGYAKAFQYLCDLSTFDGDICCYTISGQMEGGTGAGGHMWNIVTMGDGKNYLVDITNSDKDSIGQNGELFLVGTDGSLTGGYCFTIDSDNWIAFRYYFDTVSLWGNEEDSILNLASSNYDPKAFDVEYAEVTDGFHDTMVVEKSHATNADLVLKIEPKRGNVLPEILHYVLVYDSHKRLKDIRQIPCVVGEDGITLTVSDPHVKSGETYKVIVWADNQAPLINAISDIAK